MAVTIDKILGDALMHSHGVEDVDLTGLTTASIADSTDKRYVTDAQRTVISNTSGTNTGDQILSGYQLTSQKSQANGYASLGSDGKVPTSELNPIAITSTFVVNSQAAQLALTAQEGDVAVRTDLSKTYIHNGGTAGTMADWTELATPTDSVLSVNSKTGAVTLVPSDIGAEPVKGSDDNYVTDAEKIVIGNTSGTNTGDQTLSGLGGLALDGSTTGATAQGQVFTHPLIITGYDYPNTHATDSDYFNTTSATNPSDWTEVDAALATNVNTNMKGAWFLKGGASDATWKYRRQLQPIVETSYMGINFGPIYLRDGGYTVNLTYTFGIYADNGSGTIDETQYSRMELVWDKTLEIWKVRHVASNGGTTTASDYMVIPFPLVQGFYLRPMTYTASNNKRGYFGLNGAPATQTLLQTASVAITWNQPWVQIEMDRTGGGTPEDYLFIGGYNRTNLP